MAMTGWHVTANDINQWTASHRREAQENLPLLVRRLIVASVAPKHISMPAGDSILIGGWDGVLQVDKGNAFVPEGRSVWEFGTNHNIKAKADKDYQKRSKKPIGIEKSSTTFVFATSRMFASRNEWVSKKKQKTKWKQVKALNADDIEAWLDQCPPVHRWFARLIGKRLAGAWDLEQAWDNWRCVTCPSSSGELALGDRKKEVDELYRRLQGAPAIIRVHGDSEEEAYAFILGALIQRGTFAPMVLVVHDAREWDSLIDAQQPLILIPKLTEQRSFGLAVERGHYVFLPESRQLASIKGEAIALGQARRDGQTAALVAMGLQEDAAKAVVHESRGYLTVMRRHRALASRDRQRPNWAAVEYTPPLVAALLAGSWRSDNEADRAQLSRLAGMPYDELEEELHKRAVLDDPPVRLVGNVWQLVSRQDAWTLLSPFVNAAVLDRLEEVVLDVFREINPRFELPIAERWFGSVNGKTLRHSNDLRDGLAEAIAMLGSYGDADCRNVGPISMQSRVNGWVYRLFHDEAIADRWRSLSGLLPQFGEAAPEMFLSSVEESLRGQQPAVMSLFDDQGEWGGCLHSGLLWALEAISWNPDLLARVVRVLAKLSRLDPGGRWANRPARSLTEIFLGWRPQTTIPLETRMIIIDGVIQVEPEGGWKLLLNLLPERGGGISHPIHQPTFQPWAQNWKPGITKGEYFRHIEAVAERLLQHVDADPSNRWPDVIKTMPHLPKPLFERALEKLQGLQPGDFSDESRKRIGNILRDIVSRHRELSDAQWALAQEAVDRLDAVHQRFLPNDILQRHGYLFDEHFPELTRPARRRNYEERSELIEQARRAALEEIWASEREMGIGRLAQGAKFPWGLGTALGRTQFTREVEDLVFGWLVNEKTALAMCAEAYVSQRVMGDQGWINEVKARFTGTWSNEAWAAFCLGVPFGKRAFDLLGQLDGGVSEIYWKRIRGCYLRGDDVDRAEWVLQQLLLHRRPLAAIDAAAQYLHTGARRRGLSSAVLANALEQAASDPADKDTVKASSLTDDFVEVIRNLQSAQDIERDRLARIEWTYINIFRFNDIKPTTLLTHLLEDPGFFVHLVCLVFKAEGSEAGEDAEPIEVRRQRAESAWELMQLLDRIPGQQDGSIDENKLKAWVRAAREGCGARGRGRVGDEKIGEILSFAPKGADGLWPHDAVRDLLETADSEDVERGIAWAGTTSVGLLPEHWVRVAYRSGI